MTSVKGQRENEFTVYVDGGPNCTAEFTIVTTQNPDTATLEKEYVYGTTIDELLSMDNETTRCGVTRNQPWSIVSVYNYDTGGQQLKTFRPRRPRVG